MSYEAMLKQYEESSNPSTRSNPAKEYDLKNYFTTHLSEKEKSATKRIRILPTKDGSSPFVPVHAHKIQVDGEWKTFICLKHEKGQACPFCEAREALLATNREQDKELAKKYSARKMYVVKVIDRDKEHEGVKFWRFNHDYRKQGNLDKIHGVLQAVKKDIADPESGRDLLVMIARDQNNRPAVTTITHLDASPLSEDKELAQEWLSDDRAWEDVYSIKSYEYLEIIVKGGTPVWDKENKRFVDKDALETAAVSNEEDTEVTLGVPNVKDSIKVSKSSTPEPDEDEDDEEEDNDLPF
jgi:hypothetical protein